MKHTLMQDLFIENKDTIGIRSQVITFLNEEILNDMYIGIW